MRKIDFFVVLIAVAANCVSFSHPLSAQTKAEPSVTKIIGDENRMNPVADPKAVVTLGNARFTVLTPQLIRMEWAANGKFEDHASLVFLNRRLPVPKFEQVINKFGGNTVLAIKTDALMLSYTLVGDGHFTKDNTTIELTVDGKKVVWHPGGVDPQNLQGTTRTLDGEEGEYLQEPMEPGLVSRSGWAIVDDSTRPLFDKVDPERKTEDWRAWPWAIERPAGERQDLYFFGYGHDYKKALGDYVRVAGRIPIPPRFAFGAWWSRYWAYSDQEINELVKGFHENDVPLDVLVIDMDWHNTFRAKFAENDASGNPKGWTGYTWNKLLFPDPEQFLAGLHADGLKMSLNLHPASGIQPWEEHYPEMARAMNVDPASEQYIPFDITDKKFAENYMKVIHRPLEKQGIDFWWLDWQQEPTTKMAGITPTWWLNYVHFTDQESQGKRPLLFHRWGGLGNHRYQIGFSGDTVSVWETLAFQPWFTATAANVGYAYWSHDIGGHMPGAVEPELYTRWVQFGAFSPILRTHTTKNPETERRIWAYPEPYSSILRDSFQLRYAMQPYLYTEARSTYDTGVAFLHPLYYDWPSEEAAYTSKNEYVYGESMIVAPVASASDKVTGLATEKIWLPEGEWIEWPTGKHLTGPLTTEREFTIAEVPVYLRAGAIVPMEPPMRYTGEKPVDPLIVNVWPMASGAETSYEVYEDSGKSVDYKRGEFTKVPITAKQTGEELRVEIGPVKGHYAGMLEKRGYELRLPGDWPPASVKVNGLAIHHAMNAKDWGWRYEGNTLTTIIPVAERSEHESVTIVVEREAGLSAKRDELDGFAGAMTRLRGAYEAMHQTWPVSDPPDELVDAMQAGDRLGYHPERAVKEIAHFHNALPIAQAAVDEIAKGFTERMESYAKRMSASNWRPADMEAQKQKRLDALARAEKFLSEAVK